MYCYTNKADCCNMQSPPNLRRGEWIFPNGSQVKILAAGNDFHRNRGIGVVNLFWRVNATIPVGMFCCEITPPGSSQKACIGVYPEDEGNARDY